MRRKMMAAVLTMAMVTAMVSGCGSSTDTANAGNSTNEAASAETTETAKDNAQNTADGTVYKVGIVQYVDDASLNQIEKAIEAELDAKGAELGVTFDYADYTYNGQADSSTLNQIAADLVAEGVDVIIPIATPAAMIMQNATEDNQIPVVFSAGRRRTCSKCRCTGCQYHRNIRCNRCGTDYGLHCSSQSGYSKNRIVIR